MSSGGLALGLAPGSADDAAGFARSVGLVERAEALGFHSVWLPEGHFRSGAVAAPLTLLAAFASRTRRVRLATTSLLLPVHHPLRVAADVATLDALSGGRVLLGLGRGFRSPVFRGFGVAARRKRDRFDEALDAILAGFAGEPIDLADTDFAGEASAALRLPLRPVQRPHPPLVVAAFGKQGLLQAARRGLPYLASPLETLATLEENYALWREHRAGPPPVPTPEVPVMRTVYVARQRAEAEAVLEGLRRESATLRPGARTPPALARAAAGPLEERVVVGDAETVARTLRRYRERLGVDLLVVRGAPPGAAPGGAEASLERLVRDVLPHL